MDWGTGVMSRDEAFIEKPRILPGIQSFLDENQASGLFAFPDLRRQFFDVCVAENFPSRGGVVTTAGFELLKETHHANGAQFSVQGFDSILPDFFQCHFTSTHFATSSSIHFSGFATLTLIFSEQREATRRS